MMIPVSTSTTDAAWSESFLGKLPAAVQEQLRESAMAMTVPAGGTIYRADDHPRLVLLTSGLVRVVTTSAEGRKATIRYARSGDCVGVLSVVTKWQRVMVQAVTPAEVLFINVPELKRLARKEPEVGWTLAEFVGQVSTEVIEMMSATVFGTVRERLARHLLDLAERQPGGLYVTQDQQEMADAIGSVREVVARTIRDLRDHGLVSRESTGLRLDDPSGLHAIATRAD